MISRIREFDRIFLYVVAGLALVGLIGFGVYSVVGGSSSPKHIAAVGIDSSGTIRPGQLRHSTADWAGHHHIAGRADAVVRKHGSREQSTLVCSPGPPCHHLEPDDGAFPPREAASGADIAPAHVHDHYPGDTDDQKSWARPGAFEALEDAGARRPQLSPPPRQQSRRRRMPRARV